MWDRDRYIDGSGVLLATPPSISWQDIQAAMKRGELVPIWPNGEGVYPLYFDKAAFLQWRDANCPLPPRPPVDPNDTPSTKIRKR